MPEPTKNDIVQDLKLVLDITSRVDERVKMIAESQQELSQRLNRFVDEHNALTTRVRLLEAQTGQKVMDEIESLKDALRRNELRDAASAKELNHRLERLEVAHNNVTDKVKYWGGMVLQGIWAILMAYLLYKLGINN